MPTSKEKKISVNNDPKIPLARPFLTQEAHENIERCFEENFFSHGFFNKQFEEEFASYFGVKYATTCSNGTAALWLALKAAGIGKGDEVIVPSLTFSATVSPVIAVGAKPVFVDVLPGDGNISPVAVAEVLTEKTKAIIAVDLYGLPADYDELRRVIEGRKDIILIEDAAEGLGGTYKGKPIGTLGDIGCFSFFGNKILTTGEGGMCITNSKELHDAMVLYKNHGTGSRHYWVEVAGFNMRMTNLQAGIGLSQLHALPMLLDERYKIFAQYMAAIKDIPGVTALPFHDQTAPWLFTIQISAVSKNDAVAALSAQGIEARPGFFPLHRTPAFSQYGLGKEFPVADTFSKNLINLPTYIGLTSVDIERIADALREITNI